jgi:hypothetical protein
MFGLDLQMGRELDANLLFVPAAGSAVRFLKGGFSASPEQTFYRIFTWWRIYRRLPGVGVAGP